MVSFPSSTERFEFRDRGLVWNRTRPRVVHALALLLCLPLVTGAIPESRAEDARRGGLRDLLPRFESGDTIGVLELAPRLEIGRVMPEEILAGGLGHAIAMGHWTDGGVSAAAFEIDTRLVRTLPVVWRMRVQDLELIQATNVRYQLAALDGTANALTSIDDPASVIHALVTPLAPRAVDGTLDYMTLEGGLVLDLDLRDVRTSGVHVGTLTVTLESY